MSSHGFAAAVMLMAVVVTRNHFGLVCTLHVVVVVIFAGRVKVMLATKIIVALI